MPPEHAKNPKLNCVFPANRINSPTYPYEISCKMSGNPDNYLNKTIKRELNNVLNNLILMVKNKILHCLSFV